MPTYLYECVDGSGQQFEVVQKMDEPRLTEHPETGVAVQRIISSSIAVKTRGLKRSTSVNKLSPAATACGCASNASLAKQMYANSRKTPSYGSVESRKAVVGGSLVSKSGCGHSHSQGSTCSGHKH